MGKEKDIQARKFQLTINNPQAHDVTHETIKTSLGGLKSTVYFCLCDEIGDQGTPHTHVYVFFSAPVRFSTLKKLFPAAHIEKALGSSAENRAYLLKEGKWADSKGETSVQGSFEEYGDMPLERTKKKDDQAATLAELYDMIKAGKSDFEIYEHNPKNIRYSAYIERVRQAVAREEVQNKRRKMTVKYVFGASGREVTDFVMCDQDGNIDSDIYRITDYEHFPFDTYRGQSTLFLDRYRDGFDLQSLIVYCEGLPQVFPARYAQKTAKHNHVVIGATVPLEEQYRGAQMSNRALWMEFLEKIDLIVELLPDGQRLEYTPMEHFAGKVAAPTVVASPFDVEV